MQDPALDRFRAHLTDALSQHTLIKVVLANYAGNEPQLQRVIVRPIVLKEQHCLSFVYRYQTRDITRNLPQAEGLQVVMDLLGMQGFRNAHVHTPGQEWQLAWSKKGKATVRVGRSDNAQAPAAATQSHNRDKQRFLDLSRPFLHELGVTDAQGHLIPAMARKWKQINKFIEVLAAALERSPLAEQERIHVVDFGSGKGYLTFAVHDWLQNTLHRDVRVTGVELRDELVQLCQGVIQRLGLQGMDYEQGDVRDYHPAALNVMIALHACDIATDYAIHLGIRAGAEIIMCSPCCHKQVRPQLLSPHPLRPILQHGIHLGQEAEMLTDGLRALLLDAAGYDTQVFEFISLEHTNKNKMILAVKRSKARSNEEVVQQIRDIKAFYGIREQALESLLRADGLLPAD
ncbi:SAM-dependent methyltransferase [Aquabacterium sp.]|uniref:class I SAM-dependent methyltransferase n=1 Tax=Aquabacterium sp. TaxID=1872578 RepID=UPI002E324E1C|nr:SAM-dependent methyltransferase [Aquabacterium sp.]HEX5310856.1 SAM-dependent methyltransferase [Aquabacterium sp.]